MAELGVFQRIPPNPNVAQKIGYILDAPHPRGTGRNLALILRYYQCGSLEKFINNGSEFT
jgi:hypothetical protein